MLTVHHLGKSQSERILWLCEELGIPYEMKKYDRDPNLAPPAMKALHPMGTAPVITDGDLVLGESGAIMEYIIHKHGGGRLALPPSHPAYAQYLYWFHFGNASLQAVMHRFLSVRRLEPAPEHPVFVATKTRVELALKTVDDRLRDVPWLAGDELTAADIMTVFPLTTMRYFTPVDLAPYGNIKAYLKRVGERDAYRKAWSKGDPDLAPLLA